jgi:phosphocarrier protein
VDLAQRFSSDVRVTALSDAGETVDGKSAMELMLLGATAGTTLRIEAAGPDAKAALEALVNLVKNSFDINR